MDVTFANLVAVCAVAFAAPFLLGAFPKLKFPSAVVEIVAGIIIGPSVLGLVHVGALVGPMSLVGLAFLLFLGGLEVDFDRLRGPVLKAIGKGYVLSLVLAAACGLVLHALGLDESAPLVAIILSATALGVVIPVLKDAGEISTDFGQFVIAGSSVAEFGSVILLTLLFSSAEGDDLEKLAILMGIVLLAAVVGAVISRAAKSARITQILDSLADTTAQIRVRGAICLLIAFVAIAQGLGQEAILGAFIAGAILAIIDRNHMQTHPHFREKLQAIGFGFFIPVFFVASGMNFDLKALIASPSTIIRMPVFLVALLLVRGLPALTYSKMLGARKARAAGLLQATSLTFVVAASQIGVELGVISPATSAALLAAGLLSVLIFPVLAVSLMKGEQEPERELDASG